MVVGSNSWEFNFFTCILFLLCPLLIWNCFCVCVLVCNWLVENCCMSYSCSYFYSIINKPVVILFLNGLNFMYTYNNGSLLLNITDFSLKKRLNIISKMHNHGLRMLPQGVPRPKHIFSETWLSILKALLHKKLGCQF